MDKIRYEGNWKNVQEDCMLCEMEKRTEWYLETPYFVVAEKLGGGPFIVSKTHETELSDEKRRKMENTVEVLFDDYEIDVRMSLVPDHFHAHIITDSNTDLSGE